MQTICEESMENIHNIQKMEVVGITDSKKVTSKAKPTYTNKNTGQ